MFVEERSTKGVCLPSVRKKGVMGSQRYAYLALSRSFLAGENPGEEGVTLATRTRQ